MTSYRKNRRGKTYRVRGNRKNGKGGALSDESVLDGKGAVTKESGLMGNDTVAEHKTSLRGDEALL